MLKSIKRINTLRGLKKDIRNLYKEFLRLKRKKLINEYINTHAITKLHLGSNKTLLDGWLCSDIWPLNNKSIFLDVTKKFPFNDETFDYIFSEHLIEHLTQEDALNMLNECFRIMKKGARIRIGTPDLEVILKLYHEKNHDFGKEYIKWSMNNFSNNIIGYSSVVVMNIIFHNWGHQFLYDLEFLNETLHKCGFENVEKQLISNSNDINLQNIERHHENVGNFEMIEFETLVIEALKK